MCDHKRLSPTELALGSYRSGYDNLNNGTLNILWTATVTSDFPPNDRSGVHKILRANGERGFREAIEIAENCPVNNSEDIISNSEDGLEVIDAYRDGAEYYISIAEEMEQRESIPLSSSVESGARTYDEMVDPETLELRIEQT